jgi:hypothetical protein
LELPVTKDLVVQRLKKALTASQLKRSSVYWFPEPIPEGTPISMGLASTRAPFDCILVFVDLAPHLNWAHPCLYLMIGRQNDQLEKIESSLPPSRYDDGKVCSLLMKTGEIMNSDQK